MTSSSVAPSPTGADAAPVERADVIVVGAGPGGSATAAYLADHGLDVVLLEKSAFPRDKICGDGLTPRATKELHLPRRRHDRLAAHQGPAHQGRRPHAAARLARVRRLPRLRHGPHPRPARRDPGPPRGEQGRPAPRAHERLRSAPRRARAASPGSRPSASTRRAAPRVRPSPTAPRSSSRATASRAASRPPSAAPKREDRVMGVAVRAYYTTPQARRLPREPSRAVEP